MTHRHRDSTPFAVGVRDPRRVLSDSEVAQHHLRDGSGPWAQISVWKEERCECGAVRYSGLHGSGMVAYDTEWLIRATDTTRPGGAIARSFEVA